MYSYQESVDMYFMCVGTEKRIHDEDIQLGKDFKVSIADLVNMGILHLVLPIGDDQDLGFLMLRGIFRLF
jgi:hypothetical protein